MIKNIKKNIFASNYKKQELDGIRYLKLKITFVVIFSGIILSCVYLLSNQTPVLKSFSKRSIDKNLSVTDISDEAFLNKVIEGKTQEVENLLSSGANINAADKDGRNALALTAIFNHNIEIVKLLSQGKIDIDKKDNKGYTPLMLAITSGANSKFIESLIKIKADVNKKTPSGISVLMTAAGSSNDEKIIEDLLKAGAEVNYKNKDKVTALMVAAKITTNPKVIETLLKYGANPKNKDSIGISVYEVALSNEYLKNNKSLLKKLK